MRLRRHIRMSIERDVGRTTCVGVQAAQWETVLSGGSIDMRTPAVLPEKVRDCKRELDRLWQHGVLDRRCVVGVFARARRGDTPLVHELDENEEGLRT